LDSQRYVTGIPWPQRIPDTNSTALFRKIQGALPACGMGTLAIIFTLYALLRGLGVNTTTSLGKNAAG
jgi:hypothetical protein